MDRASIVRAQKLKLYESKFRERFKHSKSIILEYVSGRKGVKPRVKFICHLCQQTVEIEFRARRNKDDLICPTCLQRNKSANKFSLEFVKKQFIDAGATPTFTQYLNARTPLTFLCKCGEPGKILFGNLFYQKNEPLCKSCIRKKRIANGKIAAKHFPHPTGSDHHKWNPNLTDADRAAASYGRGAEAASWTRHILKINDHTCCISGKRGDDLCAHHLWNWAQHPGKRYDLSNGACITRELHDQFHQIYGKGNNTPDQFEEFMTMRKLKISEDNAPIDSDMAPESTDPGGEALATDDDMMQPPDFEDQE